MPGDSGADARVRNHNATMRRVALIRRDPALALPAGATRTGGGPGACAQGGVTTAAGGLARMSR